MPDTLVVLDRVKDVLAAVSGLLAAGADPQTPAAVTSSGTTVRQRTVRAPLGELAETVTAARLESPVTAVVGEAVALHDAGSWFESKPLFGWRVLVPRTKEQAGSLVARLAEHGAVADVVPTISVEPPRTPHQIEKAVKGLVTGRYEWIGFTSVNAVRAIREKFEEFGLDARAFAGLKVAAVGGVTAAALREWGIEPDLVPSGDQEQSAQGLLEIWPPFDEVLDPINRVFLPRADIATDTLVAGLQAGGWEVDDVTAYRTVRAAPPPAEVREAIKTGKFDAVVFTSSSTVRNLVGIAGKPHATTVVACIGPATAKAAEEHGLRVDVLAPEPSVDALVLALAEYGAGLRLSAAVAGEPVVRPRQRKGAARRTAKCHRPPSEDPSARPCWAPPAGSPGVPSCGLGASARRRRCAGSSPSTGCTRPISCCPCSSRRAPARRPRSRRCRASSSTRATRSGRRSPRRCPPVWAA
jgi:uroporphyrinogen III methyltransferase/synthase